MNKSKFNWGTGILITFIVFVIVIVGTAIFLMTQDVDLVESDYYAKGIDHQKQIDRMNRTNSMTESVIIEQADGFLKLSFPKEYKPEDISGKIQLYRPSDSKKDITFPLSIDTSAQQFIPTQTLDKGYWKVKLSWTYNLAEYYKESSFIIN